MFNLPCWVIGIIKNLDIHNIYRLRILFPVAKRQLKYRNYH